MPLCFISSFMYCPMFPVGLFSNIKSGMLYDCLCQIRAVQIHVMLSQKLAKMLNFSGFADILLLNLMITQRFGLLIYV